MKNKKDLILIVLLIILIAVIIYAIALIKSEGNKCIYSPLIYGAEKFSTANNNDFECICNMGISFNRTTIIQKSVDRFELGG